MDSKSNHLGRATKWRKGGRDRSRVDSRRSRCAGGSLSPVGLCGTLHDIYHDCEMPPLHWPLRVWRPDGTIVTAVWTAKEWGACGPIKSIRWQEMFPRRLELTFRGAKSVERLGPLNSNPTTLLMRTMWSRSPMYPKELRAILALWKAAQAP